MGLEKKLAGPEQESGRERAEEGIERKRSVFSQLRDTFSSLSRGNKELEERIRRDREAIEATERPQTTEEIMAEKERGFREESPQAREERIRRVTEAAERLERERPKTTEEIMTGRKETEQERYQRQQREKARAKAEEEKRRQPTAEERLKWEQEERERERRALDAARMRPSAETVAAREEYDRRQREEKRREEDYLRSPERAAKLEKERDARWKEQRERETFEQRQAERIHQALKEEKAPADKVRSLVREMARMRLDEKTALDLTEITPSLVKELKKNPDAVHAAAAIESLRRQLDRAAEDALMFSSDYKDKLSDIAREFQSKVYAEARRYGVELTTLPKAEGAAEDEKGAEKEPDPLEAAMVKAGLAPGAYERLLNALPESVGPFSEKKMIEGGFKMVQDALNRTIDADDPDLRATIDQFVNDVRRSMERHGVK